MHQLAQDVKKQVNTLDNLDNGESNENGRSEVRKDYFSMMVNRLQKDIEDLVRIA